MPLSAETWSIQAHAKLNLGLKILGRRPDGFHEIESVFVPLELHDRLDMTLAAEDHFSCSDPGLPMDGSNLVQKAIAAWRLAAREQGLAAADQKLVVHLEKSIPAGAGLGGGSSDAAHALLLLNRIFAPGLETSELYRICLLLGSDLPFFLLGKWAHVTGRGEILTPLDPFFDLEVVLYWPGIHIATATAYASLSRSLTQSGSYAMFEGFQSFAGEHLSPEKWPGNDFETVVFAEHPRLESIKQLMLDEGASYAAMSGSGSTVFGLFDSVQSASSVTQRRSELQDLVIRTRPLRSTGDDSGRGSHEDHRG